MIRAVAGEIPKLDPRGSSTTRSTATSTTRPASAILAVLRGSEARTLVDYDEIADPMRHAIVAIEDRRFWEHNGVDIRGIARALVADIRQQKVVEGGSTITQQFVKNALERDQKTIAPEGARGRARLAARALEGLAEAADPAGVPEHDLLRERRLRRPAGCPRLLRPRREGADDPGSRAPRRDPRRPGPVRPGDEPGRRPVPARGRAATRCSRRERSRSPSSWRRTTRRCRTRTTSAWAASRARRSTSSTTSSSS